MEMPMPMPESMMKPAFCGIVLVKCRARRRSCDLEPDQIAFVSVRLIVATYGGQSMTNEKDIIRIAGHPLSIPHLYNAIVDMFGAIHS